MFKARITQRTGRPGRPPTVDRDTVAVDYLIRGLPAARAARLHGVTERHVYRLTAAALAAPGPMGDSLREVLKPGTSPG